MGADKSLARPDWKKNLKGRHFSSNAEVIAATETWLDEQTSEFFLWLANVKQHHSGTRTYSARAA